MAFCAYCGTQLAEVSSAPCPSCGNPSNGAPASGARPAPVATKSGGSKTAMIVIFVVVGGFALIAILGIIAAIAIPNLLTATERSKQRRTMADMRSLATAVEAYATDNNKYPNVNDVEALRPMLTPMYIHNFPTQDGWAHPMKYECLSVVDDACQAYAIASSAKDGQFQHDSLRDYSQGPVQKFDCDLVFSQGKFVQYPEGLQP